MNRPAGHEERIVRPPDLAGVDDDIGEDDPDTGSDDPGSGDVRGDCLKDDEADRHMARSIAAHFARGSDGLSASLMALARTSPQASTEERDDAAGDAPPPLRPAAE